MVGETDSPVQGFFGRNAMFATFGLAFMWQLFRHACVLVAIPFPQAGMSIGPEAWMAVYYASICLICAIALGLERAGRHVCAWPFLFGVCGVASCGVCIGLLFPAGPQGFAAMFCQCFVAFCIAASTVALVRQALRLLTLQANVNPMLAAICSFSSAFLSIVITFVLGDVLAVDKITAAISPVLSAFCFWFAGTPMPDKSEGCVADWFEPAFLRGRMAAVVALLVVATLAKSFFDSGVGPVGEQGRMVKHIVGIVEVAGVMLLSFASTDARHFMVSVLYLLVFSLVLGIGVVASCSGSLLFTGVATVVSARVLAESTALALCAIYCARTHTSPTIVCALVLLIPEMLACFVGYGTAALLPVFGLDSMSLLVPVSVALITVVSLSVCGVSFKRELHYLEERDGSASRASTCVEDSLENAQLLDGALGVLAAQFGLTPRETDVARHLYEGHSAKRISQAECLSINTVQTHSRTLYRKLGIHSRHELEVLIDKAALQKG